MEKRGVISDGSMGDAMALATVTTYRDFESREHLTRFVEDHATHALAKFLRRSETPIEVTLNCERAAKEKHFEVGITLRPRHQAPIHVMKKATSLHEAVRSAIHTMQHILRRQHSKLVARRRHNREAAALGFR